MRSWAGATTSPRSAAGRTCTSRCPTTCLPPWSGWDDALCLVFDGGAHDPALLDRVVRQEREIRDVAFCSLARARERCADFTARRVEAALAAVAGTGATAYTESGRRSDS